MNRRMDKHMDGQINLSTESAKGADSVTTVFEENVRNGVNIIFFLSNFSHFFWFASMFVFYNYTNEIKCLVFIVKAIWAFQVYTFW